MSMDLSFSRLVLPGEHDFLSHSVLSYGPGEYYVDELLKSPAFDPADALDRKYAENKEIKLLRKKVNIAIRCRAYLAYKDCMSDAPGGSHFIFEERPLRSGLDGLPVDPVVMESRELTTFPVENPAWVFASHEYQFWVMPGTELLVTGLVRRAEEILSKSEHYIRSMIQLTVKLPDSGMGMIFHERS